MLDKPPALLDGARIRTLRHAAGLSTRDLARRLGTSPTTITNLEAETNHDDLPLRLTANLASALGVAPAELYAMPPEQAPLPASDDRVIEAALLIAGAAISTSQLADALDWTLARVGKAVRTLTARHTQTGLRVQDCGWQRHALRAATEHLTADQQHALHRLGPVQRGLTVDTAALLHKVAEHDLTATFSCAASATQQIALQSLLKQGLAVAHPSGPFVLSETARFGLYPDLGDKADRT
jgi:transcriptional regulator with XRE-family HTH domain